MFENSSGTNKETALLEMLILRVVVNFSLLVVENEISNYLGVMTLYVQWAMDPQVKMSISTTAFQRKTLDTARYKCGRSDLTVSRVLVPMPRKQPLCDDQTSLFATHLFPAHLRQDSYSFQNPSSYGICCSLRSPSCNVYQARNNGVSIKQI